MNANISSFFPRVIILHGYFHWIQLPPANGRSSLRTPQSRKTLRHSHEWPMSGTYRRYPRDIHMCTTHSLSMSMRTDARYRHLLISDFESLSRDSVNMVTRRDPSGDQQGPASKIQNGWQNGFDWSLLAHSSRSKAWPQDPIPPCALVSSLSLSSTECLVPNARWYSGNDRTFRYGPDRTINLMVTLESRGLKVVYDGLIPVYIGVILGPALKSEEVPSFLSSTSSWMALPFPPRTHSNLTASGPDCSISCSQSCHTSAQWSPFHIHLPSH